MLARRFLGCIFVLTLLFVAAGVSIYQWGDRFLIRQAIPKGHFEAGAAGSGPDYTRPSAWITGAASDGDPTQWRPVGEPAGTTGNAAVFYIHPTTYLNTDTWNAPIEAGGETEVRTQLFAKSQASAFNGVAARIW